jgi:hypothetical protein
MKIVETSSSEILDVKLFQEYIKHFPKIEQNTLDSIRSYRQFKDDGAIYNSLGLFDDSQTCVGGCYYWEFMDIGVIVIEFIFLSETIRGKGLSNVIIEHILNKSNFPIVIEVDDGGQAESYWKHRGFKKVDYNYVQPPIVEGNDNFDGLNIWTNSSVELDIDDVLKNHYWKYAFA